MKIIENLKIGINAIKQHKKTPESHIKGDQFEKFVLENIFPEESFKLLHRTGNYSTNSERFNESAQLPDFGFQNLKTKETFWVECKFRSSLSNDKIQILKPYQIQRNKKIKEPIFYCIGLFGEPSKPDEIFLIPHENIFCDVFYNHAKKFQIKP